MILAISEFRICLNVCGMLGYVPTCVCCIYFVFLQSNESFVWYMNITNIDICLCISPSLGNFLSEPPAILILLLLLLLSICLPKRKELINWRLPEMCIFIMIPYISPQYLLSMYIPTHPGSLVSCAGWWCCQRRDNKITLRTPCCFAISDLQGLIRCPCCRRPRRQHGMARTLLPTTEWRKRWRD